LRLFLILLKLNSSKYNFGFKKEIYINNDLVY
jgi:hypothetical protein